jgi:hypothetical protein
MHYKNIDRKVFVEEYLDDLTEYKFICCNGRPEAIIFVKDDVNAMYNPEWGNLFPDDTKNYYPQIPAPQDLDVMLEYAKVLSKDFKFVRVDLLKSGNKIYFGEMTFTPSSGIIQDEKFDIYMGERLEI